MAKSNNNRGKNKQTHGNKVNTALGQVTSGTNLNASLINPKFTPPPKSKFSSLFKTKGTKSPIREDVLFAPPSTDETRYKAEITPRSTPPSSFRNAVRVPAPKKPSANIVQEGKNYYQLNPADLRAYNTNVSEIARITAANAQKASNLTTARANYDYDMGIRRTFRSSPKNRKGTNPGQTPTQLGAGSRTSRV